MATWNDLRHHIHSNYVVNHETPGMISLVFTNVNQGRSQIVIVSHTEMDMSREQWIHISSPVAERSAVQDLWSLLDEIATFVVGGLSVDGRYLTVRHAVPLADMSVEEFVSPLEAVVGSADRLESMLSRVDAL